MTKTYKAVLVAGVAVALSSLALWSTARAEEARTYLGVYGGLAFPEKLEVDMAGTPVPDLELAEFGDNEDYPVDGSILGVKLGFVPERDFTWFGLEMEGFYAPNRLKDNGQPLSGEEFSLITVAFNSIFRIPFGPLQPYVGVGPSIVWSNDFGGSGPAFGFNMLAGARILLGSHLFIFGEAKRNQSELSFSDMDADVSVTQNGLVAGIALAF